MIIPYNWGEGKLYNWGYSITHLLSGVHPQGGTLPCGTVEKPPLKY